MALKRQLSKITPLNNIPEIFDFPRDIQPILDKHCVACHDYDATAKGGPYSGKVILTGDNGFSYSHSFVNLTVHKQFSDARNGEGNKPPRTIGTSASPLMKKISGGHYGVKLSAHEADMIRYWIESGANFSGTYASAGNKHLERNSKLRMANCFDCHNDDNRSLFPVESESLNRTAFGGVVNLTRPEKSLALLAPLSKDAGGWGLCKDQEGNPVFSSKNDPSYCQTKEYIEWAAGKRFDINVPMQIYFDEMKVFGLLDKDFDPLKDPYDVYELDDRYFRSLWYNIGQIR